MKNEKAQQKNSKRQQKFMFRLYVVIFNVQLKGHGKRRVQKGSKNSNKK
jgi:hypothetical protein